MTGNEMTEYEKLRRDIATLRESIHLDWVDLASKNLSAEERVAIRQHSTLCVKDLVELLTKLDSLAPN